MSVRVLACVVFVFASSACPPKEKAPRWRGVIAFIDDPDHASEDWNYYSDQIAQGCKGENAYFAWADASNLKVTLGTAVTVDIAKAVKGRSNVWLLVESGPKVTPIDYDPSNVEQAVEFCGGSP